MTTDDKAGRLGHAARSLGRFGVWRGGREVSPDLAVTIEQLGYGALWIGGSPDGELAQIEELLAATTTLTLATGIVNIWQDDAQTVAASYRRIEARFPGRFLLGVGAGHPEATQVYTRPYDALSGYVDALLGAGVPPGAVVLAALGPKVLRLAAERTAGAHPYLITPEHTKQAREIMGAGPLLAPEQKVVLDDDPVQARAIGRPRVEKP
jgi:probable F420-dependent oxidoreductase